MQRRVFLKNLLLHLLHFFPQRVYNVGSHTTYWRGWHFFGPPHGRSRGESPSSRPTDRRRRRRRRRRRHLTAVTGMFCQSRAAPDCWIRVVLVQVPLPDRDCKGDARLWPHGGEGLLHSKSDI